jgi:hypothetical protein
MGVDGIKSQPSIYLIQAEKEFFETSFRKISMPNKPNKRHIFSRCLNEKFSIEVGGVVFRWFKKTIPPMTRRMQEAIYIKGDAFYEEI